MKTGWHFMRQDMTLGYGDGRKVVPGETLFVEGEIKLCKHGLHWSHRAIDALKYAAGPIVSVVEPVGEIILGYDKGVSQGRKCIWVADATDVLMEFTRKCAFYVIHLWDAPQVVKEYLETGNEALRNMARDAASAAVDAAALDAAWYAAEAAARAAALDAALDAAWYAAEAAARAAAWNAARAALDAARNAARNAARERLNARLEEMLIQLRGM